ncbi:DNA cytosine methyltransferase [Serratia sp. PAMC26656]|uniref:DNA cytosine methyltransferase n=1 Tax=Serratia sp. PAMC26656 TaxID=2775909 RepID=UPI0018F5B6A0|nr:DNA cytosine methyltransferase [Serratia sp. PAMC26656]MBJ7892946.1 DNA cytosine methyltransferase [Serratia sp. PAMC26656]
MDKKNCEVKPVVVDLFAGAGGFSLAAIEAGCSIAVAIENDPYAVETYKENLLKYEAARKVKVLDNSILDYIPETVRAENLGDVECDLLLGGPPCQGFSTHRILDAGVDDPRNQLVLAYFRFVKAFRPRIFLMENVPGILWERHKSYLDKFYEEGKKAGYQVLDPIVLDARDFGVPQRRKRVFILGIRDHQDVQGFVWPPEATHVAPGKAVLGQKTWVSCADVFKSAPKGDENDIHMNHGSELVDAFRNTPPNGGSRKDSGRILPCHKKHDGHKDVYGRINPAEPAPTMTTACINPSKGRFVHPTEHHGITLRQAARIQTFPDSFTFIGGLTAAGRQIGNAVPVELGKHLIQYIKTYLIDKSFDQARVDVPTSAEEHETEKV